MRSRRVSLDEIVSYYRPLSAFRFLKITLVMVIFRTFIILILALMLADLSSAQQSAVKGVRMMRVRGNVLAVEDSDRIKVAADDGNVFA